MKAANWKGVVKTSGECFADKHEYCTKERCPCDCHWSEEQNQRMLKALKEGMERYKVGK
jgi:hypothetical protein